MIIDKLIDIEINNYNRKKYEDILNLELKDVNTIEINQLQIPQFSRTLVCCECDICGKQFERKRIDIKNQYTTCGRECSNKLLAKNNPNPKKEPIIVSCETCEKKYPVAPSVAKKNRYNLCSRECYKKHRSKFYYKENLYNYQDIQFNCSYCNKEFKGIKWDIENRKHKFCTQECYFSFRKENYKEFYYQSSLNRARKETIPEKLTREYLEKHNIKFIQEYSIDNTYFGDFYVPKFNSIIEVYGDYWHVNPKVYNYENLPVDLNERVKKDRKRNGHIKRLGYDLYIIWESEVYENIDYFMGEIFNKIASKHSSATTAR